MPTDLAPTDVAFETERLCMRRLGSGDESMFVDLYTDAETMRHIGPPLSPESAARRFRKLLSMTGSKSAEPRFFAVLEKTTWRAIGLCAIQPFDPGRQAVEVGMMLRAEARARGYATEGLAALVTATFSTLPADRVWVQYSQEHTVAERLVIAVGFTQCAEMAIEMECNTKCVWSIDRSAWSSTSATIKPGEDNVERDRLS